MDNNDTWTDAWFNIIITALLFLVGGTVLAFIIHIIPDDIHPEYNNGQSVRVILDNSLGMVIASSCGSRKDSCEYKVRFSVRNILTDVSLLGADGPIRMAPFYDVSMRGFEIKADQ